VLEENTSIFFMDAHGSFDGPDSAISGWEMSVYVVD
jgi:hypothetical protein